MPETLTIARAAVLLATLAGAAIAGEPPGPMTFPSGQDAGSSGRPGLGVDGLPALPGAGGPRNPDGSPILGAGDVGGAAGGGSGAFDGNPGGAGGAGGGAGAGAGSSGFAPGLGGFAGASGAPPGVIGDFQPISKARVVSSAATSGGRFPVLPTPIPPPRVPNGNPGVVGAGGTTSILFKLTGLKLADNQSPIPQDRVFTSFNYFDNLNASEDRRQLSPVRNLQVYHELFGIEKTFLDGRASIGFRVPLNTISLRSTPSTAGLGGSSTSSGDLSIFMKYVLYRREDLLLSGGFQVTPPTGPGAFGGNKYYSFFRDTQIQPFLGYLVTRDRLYLQGFSSINVPTTSRDVTLIFTDVSVGYYAYRATDPGRLVTAIVPTAEAHLTTPLNHRGDRPVDLANTPDILDLTFGTNLELRRRAILSAAYVTPVTGPKPFNAELVLLLNVKFGGSAGNRSSASTPPILR